MLSRVLPRYRPLLCVTTSLSWTSLCLVLVRPTVTRRLVLGHIYEKDRAAASDLYQQKNKRRSYRAPRPSHLNVVLSKAALSGPSVCLRARAPSAHFAFLVRCSRSRQASGSGVPVHPPPGSRGRAAGLQDCVPVAPWVKTEDKGVRFR